MMLAREQQAFSAADDPPSATAAEEDAAARIRRFGNAMISALFKRCASLLSSDWRILQWRRQTNEAVISSVGPIEIRQVPYGCLVQTRVKGEMTPARGTALVRLAKYVGGHNRSDTALGAERPVLQHQIAPGLWEIGIHLVDVDDVRHAPVPRGRRMRIVAREAGTCAVLSKIGRPTEYKVASAEIEILDAIARTHWFATGTPIVRIQAPGSIMPMTGTYEVAVPVTRQAEMQQVAWQDPISRPAQSPSLPVR
jgi:SOUL heme-binding protein